MADFYASFGSSKTGLATVGYEENDGNTIVVARTTTNVVEVGGGVYMVPLTLNAATTGLLWDTGETVPVFAFEDIKENRVHELLDVVEGTLDHAEVMRILLAAMAGKASGLDVLAPVFRDLADAKDRITATSDADGNRLTIVLDATP